MSKPHDALFRHVFGAKEHAVPLLQSCLPPALAAGIDWSTLQRCPEPQVDERLRDQVVDLLFAARLGRRRILLYTVLDHASGNLRFAAFKMLGYVVGTLKDHLRDPRHRGERHLPLVMPVIVHCGRDRWRSPLELFELFGVEDLPAALAAELAPTLPRFRYRLDDVQQYDLQRLRGRALTLVGMVALAALQFLAPVAHDIRGLRRWLAQWADACCAAAATALSPTGQDAMEAVRSYILQVTRLDRRRLQVEFQHYVDGPTMKKFVSTWDRAVREGKAKGKLEGKLEGRLEGQSHLLLRQLRRRFGNVPPAIEARVQKAAADELDRWSERVLDAASIGDVFAE